MFDAVVRHSCSNTATEANNGGKNVLHLTQYEHRSSSSSMESKI